MCRFGKATVVTRTRNETEYEANKNIFSCDTYYVYV